MSRSFVMITAMSLLGLVGCKRTATPESSSAKGIDLEIGTLLRNHGASTEAAGEYLVAFSEKASTYNRVPELQQEIEVFVKDGILRTNHRFYMADRNFATLIYALYPKDAKPQLGLTGDAEADERAIDQLLNAADPRDYLIDPIEPVAGSM